MKRLPRFRHGGLALCLAVCMIAAAAGGHAGTRRPYGGNGGNARVSVTIHRIIDGDSLVVLNQENYLEIRLWGIDAPEYDQPGSASAKERLKELTSGRPAEIVIKDRDRYGRLVVMLECDGNNINETMVASGSAWVHIYYCKESECERWKKLEREARKNHLGLWKWKDPVEPWKWKSRRR